MLHKLYFFIIVLSSLFIPCAHAESAAAFKPLPATTAAPNTPSRGALFRIEHQGNTTYLFGTIHVGKPAFYPLGAAVTQAFAQAHKLVVEVDIGNAAALLSAMQKYGVYATGDGIQNHLSKSTLAKLKQALNLVNISFDKVQQMKPWLLANLLLEMDLKRSGYESTLGVDVFFLNSAKQQNKAVVELETADYQVSLFEEMSASQQELYLGEILAEIKAGTILKDTTELMRAWSDADIAAQDSMVRKIVNDKTFAAEFTQRVLLDRRNPAMAGKIEGFLKNEKATFVGVGLLHLIGERSIPALLRQRGYAVERVY